MKRSMNRREFLKLSAAGATLLPMLSANNLLAAQTSDEYKAIVVIYLKGGADVFNMVAPIDDAHQAYADARGGIGLPKESLLPISDQYGMRENMQAMQQLYAQQKLAIIANVGTLLKPVTAAEVKAGAAIPFELFAHNTQRRQWMFADAKGQTKNGWASRIADNYYSTPNPYSNINVAGTKNLLQYGGKADALQFENAFISPDTMTYYGFGPKSGGGELGKVYQELYENKRNDPHKLMAEFAKERVNQLNLPLKLLNLFDGVQEFEGFSTGTHETGKPLGSQLELVAKILSVKDNFPNKTNRQIFFVDHHGWDTHDKDNESLVGYLSESLGAFQNALQKLGIEEQVTTITASEFGRSITANNSGTDHGWGSHAFVMGGAVKGGQIFGEMPLLSKDSPDFWQDRLVPSTSIDQYLSTIVRWFGATESELASIFPNLTTFTPHDMGFMT